MVHGSCLLWRNAIVGLSPPILPNVITVPHLSKDVKAKKFLWNCWMNTEQGRNLLCDRTNWIIYRGPGFLVIEWFGSSPPPSPSPVSNFSLFLSLLASSQLTEERGRAVSRIIRPGENLAVYKSLILPFYKIYCTNLQLSSCTYRYLQYLATRCPNDFSVWTESWSTRDRCATQTTIFSTWQWSLPMWTGEDLRVMIDIEGFWVSSAFRL